MHAGTILSLLSRRTRMSIRGASGFVAQHVKEITDRRALSTMVVSELGPSPQHPTYKDALTYLNSLQSDYLTLQERRKKLPQNLQVNEGLNEMIEWVQRSGYQPSDFDRLNLVHVAGTKGKGTTCAFVNSILAQYHERYGLPEKVGLYTSPHLLSVCERIRINSKPISEEKFTKYFFELWDALAHGATRKGADPRQKPFYFRYLTLLSFHAFLRENVDVAIYEVGVGGQFDSTNVMAKPAAIGITSLGIDHVQVLGNTVEEIAWHKAGIMKTGSPAYSVWQPEGAMQVLKRRAEERQVTLREVPIGNCLSEVAIEPDEDYQKRNASLAIVLSAHALARVDVSKMEPDDLPRTLTSDPIPDVSELLDHSLPPLFKAGLTSTIWRGRGETVERPYGKWLLDGAHTKESLEIVSDWYGRTVQNGKSERQEDPLCILVFNQQEEFRNARQLIETVQQTLWQKWGIRPHEAIFCPYVTYRNQQYKLDFVDSNSNPEEIRSLVVQREYAKMWKEHHPEGSTHVLPSVEEAVETVRSLCNAKPDRRAYILATGSFRIVGGVLTILEGEGIATEPSSSPESTPRASPKS